MEISKLLIADIKPAKYNPRLDLQPGDVEYEKIKRSIVEFDLVEPLVVNKRTGNLVGGHQRLKVLQELGKTEVEAVIVDLSESREKALNLALNKAQGAWDLPKLKDLLLEIDTGEFDIGITGFDEKEIEDLMNQLFVPDENEKDDDVPEVPEEPITKKGDLYKLGEHRLLCGDATIIDDVEKLMDGQKADMVFTDPPYGMNLDTDFSRAIGSLKSIGIKNKTRGNIYKSVIGDDKDFNPIPFLKLFDYVKEQFWFGADYYAERINNKNEGSWLVWDKRKESQADAIGSEFELIWSKSKHKRRILRHDWFGFLSSQNTKDAQNRLHPTQKPISLIIDMVKQWGKDCNIILDLFGGSGSTLIACEKLNRKCFMMELDEHYCDVIVKRYEDYTGKKAELL